MKTQDLLNEAVSALNSAQNEPWYENSNTLAIMLFKDAQTRALIAIAQELKRFNDNSYFGAGNTVGGLNDNNLEVSPTIN